MEETFPRILLTILNCGLEVREQLIDQIRIEFIGCKWHQLEK